MSSETVPQLGVEPAAAVSVWGLGHAAISLRDSEVAAISGNAKTFAAAIQAQDFVQMNIDSSKIQISQNQGSIVEEISPSAIIVGNGSVVTIQNSVISGELSGTAVKDFHMITSFGGGTIKINNSKIRAINTSTSPQGQQQTIAAFAMGNGSVIYLDNTTLSLLGMYPLVSAEQAGGLVVITP